MNLNVKLDGDEEQTLQYVNRFAINIPSGAAAFNLNVVNSGLSNQSYIINPVNAVGQNIVTYQPPMTLQSFIALPTEPDGNIIHSLPVGVSVPIGIPVSTGLLQNHNYVNTGIIIGNEDCNTSGVLKSTPDNVTSGDDLKISYVQKPLEDLTDTVANTDTIEPQYIGLNCSSQVNSENDVKKPCPLEMSIKAANIDMECGSVVTVLMEDKSMDVERQHIVDENMPFRELKNENLQVPLELAAIEKPNNPVLSGNCELKRLKTEITWENNNIKGQENSNDFQESLICEVEEVNDDEEEEEEQEEEEEDENVDDDNDDEEGEEEEEGGEEEEDEGESSSSEESDTLPLSVALKLKKTTRFKNSENSYTKKKNMKAGGGNILGNKSPDKNKVIKKRKQSVKRSLEVANCDSDWSDSDDDVLNLKRIKNEFNYKCFYESRATKSTNPSLLKVDDKYKKFVRVRSCCSKLECAKKISAKDQKAAHKNFYDLESEVKRDSYLINCIEHIQKNRKVNVKEKNLLGEGTYDAENKKLFMATNIQMEIENESNGNQKLSDEIQNAIKESLKDCIVSERGNDMNAMNEVDSDDEKIQNSDNVEKSNWIFYIIIDRCKKKVCLQFLLKLFRIAKNRIKNLQRIILSGTPVPEDSYIATANQKVPELWEVVKSHLDSLATEECIDCNANPRHRFLYDWCTREYLFDNFKEFYLRKIGKEPSIKYASYKRLLDKENTLSFLKKREGMCAECEGLRKQQERKLNKTTKGVRKSKKLQPNTGIISVKEKRWPIESNSEEDLSDNEPLSKHRKSKLSKLNQTASNTKPSGKRSLKNNSPDKKSKTKLVKEKSRQSMSRGRDVWSLMLLHLETMPYKECINCVNKKKHRFLDSTFTTQGLFEDYRKYFLKETNSELGLGFTMYEKYFTRNCNYTLMDVNINAPKCPRCELEGSKC